MRTSEERVQELHRRMDDMKKEKERRVFRIEAAAAGVLSLAAVIVMALLISRMPMIGPEAQEAGAAGSIFANNVSLGYIVVALLAFFLGTVVTVFCVRIKKQKGLEGPIDGRES